MKIRFALAGSLVLSLTLSASASAQQLIAVGQLSGSHDLNTATSGLLENGATGNMLGGIGSGLAHAGGNVFLALPDRGPNGGLWAYDSCLDETASYIPRFHTVTLDLTAGPGLYALPFVLTPTLQATTPLSNASPLVYGNGSLGCAEQGAGAPLLNVPGTYYFTGRSDNFNPAQPSTNPQNARLDPEGIRVAKNGQHVFITDEYGPYVYRFNRATGQRDAVYTLPPKFAVGHLRPTEPAEIADNTAGRTANKGMEGLAMTPDGSALVGMMQSALLQDGGDGKGQIVRMVRIDLATGATQEYAYRTENKVHPGDTDTIKTTVSEIVAVNSHVFLVDERDSKGLGDGSAAAFKRLYLVDIATADDVSGIIGRNNLLSKVIKKYLFLDVVTALQSQAGLATTQIPAKIEGMAFGEDVNLGAAGIKHTVYLANDNDFSTDAGNPNQFFAFAFADDDLASATASDNSTLGSVAGTFVPQVFTPKASK